MTADNERPPAPSHPDAPAQPSDGERPLAPDRWATPVLAALTLSVGAILAIADASPTSLLITAVVYIALVGVWLAIVDLRTHRLPDRIIFPAYGVLAALLAFSALSGADVAAPGRAAATAALTGLLYTALNRWGSMGLGDVKLGILLGLILGWAGWSAAIAGPIFGFLIAFVVAIALLIAGKGKSFHIAFGPYLIGGALIAIVQPLTT
ncbi:prepilin peptidase [Rathayibacter rathayi]|uniref:prepilin peptidase n=1 Tax=Rathayibacter rathayi TaxID=33887 RepID=UPI0015E1D208|nr:prepilin peptidase [Rathayibacter rathayi]